MLSSKLKSWMESHLTRKKSSGSNSEKSASSGFHGGGTKTTSGSGSYKELTPTDRIAHRAPVSSILFQLSRRARRAGAVTTDWSSASKTISESSSTRPPSATSSSSVMDP
ncbi:hypothetical protein DAPPUDRAFT_248515 [Daphnia pulex]|uniref:Uncharacterized protein n=1 Tax=Daphnia pulex TaxID=6669 RepID=E9GUT7_DAPPU|nr:hypothetical protein DAPPUDRAFT_248515 [Daphnia pulex]|eukprot:EFX76793.1 hypothetical protein DAPPUDRAFT_248515 [Daphnia pulex]